MSRYLHRPKLSDYLYAAWVTGAYCAIFALMFGTPPLTLILAAPVVTLALQCVGSDESTP